MIYVVAHGFKSISPFVAFYKTLEAAEIAYAICVDLGYYTTLRSINPISMEQKTIRDTDHT